MVRVGEGIEWWGGRPTPIYAHGRCRHYRTARCSSSFHVALDAESTNSLVQFVLHARVSFASCYSKHAHIKMDFMQILIVRIFTVLSVLEIRELVPLHESVSSFYIELANSFEPTVREMNEFSQVIFTALCSRSDKHVRKYVQEN